MFCNNCGSQLHDGAVFCGNCGAKIEVQVAPQAPVQDAPQQPTYTAPQQPTYTAPQPTYVPSQPTYVPPPRPGTVPPVHKQDPELDSLARSTMILGIVGLATGFNVGVPGIIVSIMALKKAKEFERKAGSLYGKAQLGRKLAKPGIIVGIAMTIVMIILFIVYIAALASMAGMQ